MIFPKSKLTAVKYIVFCGKCKKSLQSQLRHEFGAHFQLKTCSRAKIPRLDFFLKSLSFNTFLTDLDLSVPPSHIFSYCAGIDDKGIVLLSKTLSVNTASTHLNLHLNLINESGAASLSLRLFQSILH